MAKIYGQLEKAQGENTTSDTGSHPKGMITYRTDLNLMKVSNGTVYKALIDEDTAQTLSTKTLAAPSITGATTYNQITTPSNPSAGANKLYFKSNDLLYSLNSSGTEVAIGSTSGGYIPTATKTSAYSAVNGDYVLADSSGGTFAVTLPTATSGTKVAIKKIDSSSIAVTVVGTIDGVSGDSLNTQNETIEYLADGTSWHQLSRKVPSVWISYSPVVDATTTAPTYGTVAHNVAYWRRVGDSMQISWSFRQTSAGSGGSGNYLIPLPSGYSIDSTKIKTPAAGLVSPNVGFGRISTDAGGGMLTLTAQSTTTLNVAITNSTVNESQWSSSFFAFGNTNVEFSINVSVPISGWK